MAEVKITFYSDPGENAISRMVLPSFSSGLFAELLRLCSPNFFVERPHNCKCTPPARSCVPRRNIPSLCCMRSRSLLFRQHSIRGSCHRKLHPEDSKNASYRNRRLVAFSERTVEDVIQPMFRAITYICSALWVAADDAPSVHYVRESWKGAKAGEVGYNGPFLLPSSPCELGPPGSNPTTLYCL